MSKVKRSVLRNLHHLIYSFSNHVYTPSKMEGLARGGEGFETRKYCILGKMKGWTVKSHASPVPC